MPATGAQTHAALDALDERALVADLQALVRTPSVTGDEDRVICGFEG